MRRIRALASIALAAALTYGGASVVFADSPISLDPLANQSIDIYPDIANPANPVKIPLSVSPNDAELAVETTSTDKVEVTVSGADLVVQPKAAGSVLVKVTASTAGHVASQSFRVTVTEKYENGMNWHGDAKIGGSGYVTASVYSKIEPNVLYAMTDIGGAYRYDYEAEYWHGLNDYATDAAGVIPANDPRGPGRAVTFVTSIVPDPVKKGRVYMTAGQSNSNLLLRSDNYGDDWETFQVPGMAMNGNDGNNRSTGPRLAVDPGNNKVLYYAARGTGLWISTNRGETWTRMNTASGYTTEGTPVNYDPALVTIDPISPKAADGRSLHIVVGTTGTTGSAWTGTAPNRYRQYGALWETRDGGATWTEVTGQPAPGARDYAGFVAEHVDWDQDNNLVVAYAEFGRGVNSYNLEAPTDHSQYVLGEVNNVSAIGSNSNFAHDGRVYRVNYGTAAAGRPVSSAVDITPPNVNTREYPPLEELQADYPGQKLQRGGFAGISVDRNPANKGAIVVSTAHRHDRMAEEVVMYTPDNGVTWRVAHSEVVGTKDFRGYGYIDKDNGWGAAVHWAFDLQLNPFNSDEALFTTGAGFWMTRNLTAAKEPITPENQVEWGFWNDGLEETVMWNVYSPTRTKDYLYATYADWGSMSWQKDYTISPKNSLVNRESVAARQYYTADGFLPNGDPAYDAANAPIAKRWDADVPGAVAQYDVAGTRNAPTGVRLGTGWYLKQPYRERWMNTQNLDWAGLKQDTFVFTPSGNYQNTNCSTGAISFDEGQTATPLAWPTITGTNLTLTCANGNAGWISINADASNVVWTFGGQAINRAFWADVSQGAASPVVGSHEGRQVAESEVRVIERRKADGSPDWGDRNAWTPVTFFDTNGSTAITTGNVKIFSDKVDPNLMYGFQSGAFFVSNDGGKTFVKSTLSIPAVNWNSNGHGQGANNIDVDPYRAGSIWLAPNQAAGGLTQLYLDETNTWQKRVVGNRTGQQFQQVGIGLNLLDNGYPALYAMGVVDDTTDKVWRPWYGAYRSLDGGVSWKRVNDDEHQFGDLRALSGDTRVFGRVYLGTGTRGTRVADVIWREVTGPSDFASLASASEPVSVRLTATPGTVTSLDEVTAQVAAVDAFGDDVADVTAAAVITYSIDDIEIDRQSDASFTYRLRATYTFATDEGVRSLTSNPVNIEVVNADSLTPIITGTAKVGGKLTAVVPAADWNATLEWFRDGRTTGVTGDSYRLMAADSGASITVKATASRGGLVLTRESHVVSVIHDLIAVKVKLNQSQLRLVKGKSFKIEDAVFYDGGASSAGGTTWTSSNPKVATVNRSTGVVKAKKSGTATITATSTKADITGKKPSASIKVTVVSKKPKSKVTKVWASVPKSMTVDQVADVTGKYSSAKATGVKVTYSSAKPSVATITSTGRIVARSKGTATIKIKAGGKTKTYKVTVK